MLSFAPFPAEKAVYSLSGRVKGAVANFWRELNRRKVVKTTIAYIVAAWALIEVSATVLPALGLPETAVRYVVLGTIVGLPLIVALSWRFDIHRGTTRLFELTQTPDSESSSDKGDRRSLPPDTGSAMTSVAVQPFTNLAGDGDESFLAAGISAELHCALARIPQLRVLSRGTLTKDPAAAGDTDAQYVITGSVRPAGDNVRVSASLLSAADGSQVWAQSFDRNRSDVLSVEQDIAESVAAEFGGARLRQDIARAANQSTSNLDAWQLVQRARAYIVAFNTKTLDQAAVLLRQAVDVDPDYGLAHAALASVLGEQALHGTGGALSPLRDEALKSAARATSLAPVDPYVMKLCGVTWAYFGELEQSILALRGATNLAPYDYGSWGYLGWPLVATGSEQHLDELHGIVERLLSLSGTHPGTPFWLYHQSVLQSCRAEHSAAVEAGRQSVERNPAFPWGWMQYANALGSAGSSNESAAATKRALELAPTMTIDHYRSVVLGMSANEAAAATEVFRTRR